MGKHKNAKQEEVMTSFMEAHPDIARACVRGNKLEVDALWERLTVDLNRYGPPVKVSSEWKKSWTDWKGHIKKKQRNKKMDNSRSDLSNTRLTKNEELIVKICRFNEKIDKTIELKNSRNVAQDDDVVDDTSLLNIILGEDQSTNDSFSSASARSSLKRRRETSSQENLNDFLSSEFSFQEDLKGFPSFEASINKDMRKSLEVISKTTQTLALKAENTSKCLKRISNVLTDYCSLQAEKNKETQRHNRVMEELLREKNMIKMRSLELQELQFKREQEKGRKSRTLVKYEME